MKNFNQKLLSASVSMLMTMSICHVVTAQASDIDIYKLPDATELTVMMMLDLSGSMDLTAVSDNGPCDLGTVSSSGKVTGDTVAGGYSTNFCYTGTKGRSNIYYYRANSDETNWWKCTKTSDNTVANCSTLINRPDNEEIFKYTRSTLGTGSNNFYYYYNYGETKRYYDRISRLKNSLYILATSNDIPLNTKIGIGTFSYNADGNRGYVRIAADQWGAVGSVQRDRVLTLIRNSGFKGSGGTPTSSAYAEAAAYLLGTTTGGNSTYSGIGVAEGINVRTGTNTSTWKYVTPLDKTKDPLCSGKGIYVLTDGEPNASTSAITSTLMKNALNLSGNYSYTTGLTNNGYYDNNNSFRNYRSDWQSIGSFAKSLNTGSVLQPLFSSTQRNNEHVIKTAVVGFGSVFDVADPRGEIRKELIDPKTGNKRTYYDCSKLTGNDQKNACNWGMQSKFSDGTTTTIAGSGGYGEGGFYSASSTEEVIESLKNFVEDMKPEFDPIPTGSPTLPVDALNPIQIQPYGYYARFTPKPQEPYQLWIGNLNKYHIKDGQLYDTTKTIRLIQDSGQLNNAANGIWNGGVLGKLPLGTFTDTASGTQSSNRTVFTNRQINTASGVAEEISSLQRVNLRTLFNADAEGTLRNDPKKNYWLNILGYKVNENATGLTLATLPTDIQRQLGATMHSKPILLTQEGKIVVPTSGDNKGQVTTTGRKDYLLFGSNQGSLHVIEVGSDTDTDRGKEAFTFVPHEMMERQPKAFLNEGATNGGRANLYYGMDGAWTAYTQYVSKTDKTLTVGTSGRKDNDGKDLNQKGLQWVYGGLRMGGRGYYGLDLTSLSSPSLKFHINPDDAVVKDNGVPRLDASGKKIPDTNNPLNYMGQSWSKPTIAWVNWGGVRKLVMFVGGGYDEGYEAPDYDQDNNTTTPKKGAGVYMFDAGSGDLLWWASANVRSTTTGIGVNDANLKYSVVSQINAVDRDNDGLVDHLFFGDLGGQAFRIDLNNKATSTANFSKRIVRLYNAHTTAGASPRFYEMPSFSVHSGVDGLFGVVALSSGNRSSPLAGVHRVDGVDTITTTANDAVYVIYDNDVARSDLYTIANSELRTSSTNTGVLLTTITPASFSTLRAGIDQKTGANYNGGWKYQYGTTAGRYKGMNEIYALDGMLYVNVYHKDGTGIVGACGSGVIGDTELYQFCLPSGKCSFYTTETTGPNKTVLGGGILGTGLGLGVSNKFNETGLIVKKPDNFCDDTANKNKPECQLFDTGARLQHLRWYESR
ncbi:hypothetical protein [Acinetobacter colistiniresistens]|uniref:PilC beta-propeller domain-containing protein n=1 Tax=Acinetobacter colistiniresistens TaxID=280145 RepID=S3TIQ2_9GAMM|nr:hypothetical protein [Acinetobacter colistiniresistens]EPG41516.1 hypothetical protein F907_00388 [Acinetobacter colistiniresistens]